MTQYPHSHSVQKLRQLIRQHAHAGRKTLSYTLMHMAVAVSVAWAVTGNLRLALAISMVEPLVQAVAYHLHEQAWAKAEQKASAATTPPHAPAHAQVIAA